MLVDRVIAYLVLVQCWYLEIQQIIFRIVRLLHTHIDVFVL